MALGSAPEWERGAWSAVLVDRVAGDFARCGWWSAWKRKARNRVTGGSRAWRLACAFGALAAFNRGESLNTQIKRRTGGQRMWRGGGSPHGLGGVEGEACTEGG